MRKFNIRKPIELHPRMHSQPTESQILNLSHASSGSRRKVDPLESFHESLIKKQQLLHSIHRETYTKKHSAPHPLPNQSLLKAQKQVQYLKGQLDRKKQYVEERRQLKLDHFIQKLQEHVSKGRYQSLQLPPVQPVYYPFPLQNTIPPKEERRNRRLRSTIREDSSFYPRSKPQNRESNVDRVQRNLRRFRKVANSVLFTIYLKRYCHLMRTHRELVFSKLKGSLKPNLNTIKEDLFKLLKPFFSVLLDKRQISLLPEEDQHGDIRKQKVGTILKLVQMVLSAVKKWVGYVKQSRKFTELLYHLCRHGNYSCTEPILTQEELKLSCISPAFQYVSADSNLEIAAFINLLFFKLLIYNVMLSPYRFASELKDDVIKENLETVSSVLYQLAIDIQDSYLSKTPKKYKLGNYCRHQFVSHAQPLIYGNNGSVSGELISGLKGEQWVKKNFNLQSWRKEKAAIVSILGQFHQIMKSYHHKMAQKTLEVRIDSSLS